MKPLSLARVPWLLTLVVWVAGAAPAQDIPADSPVAPQLQKAEAAVQAIVAIPDDKRTFDNTLGAIDDMQHNLQSGMWRIEFMQAVSTDADERRRGELASEHSANWLTALGKREDLYRAVKAYAATNPKLEGEQKRLLEHALRDYRRAGMDLPPDQREQLKQIELEMNKLSIEFDRNIRDDATRVELTRAELHGVPDDVLAGLESRRSGDLYLVGLEYPVYVPITNYCDIEATRHKMYVAYRRMAGQKNVEVLEKLIALRQQAAALLGYATTADYMIETRMAKNADTVWKFYADLKPLVRRKAELEYAELQAEKRAHTGDAEAVLQPWDQGFYEQRLLKSRYAVDSQKVAEYFPLERVKEGLFAITQKLYGLEYRDVTAQAASRDLPLWHPDVQLYEVWDKAENRLLGMFYLDLFPRDNKYNHAAQFPLIPRKVWSDGTITTPLVALVCNFTKPTADKPSLMMHREVVTFFHEFGHCLHSILTEAHLSAFAGTSVSRDFVEAPSQMFENWCWNADVLQTFARHYQTGEPIPSELVGAMVRAKNMTLGLFNLGQMWLGISDLTYHTAPNGVVDTTRVGNQAYEEVTLYKAAPNTFFQAGFGHMTGYHAGYYGYLWSQVYAQDLFSPFAEKGLLDPEAGMRYRRGILAKGGTLDEIDVIRAYLGREPRMEPFLQSLGLAK